MKLRNFRLLSSSRQKPGIFYGEVGVERHIPLIMTAAGKVFDSDYDHDNPDGTAWGRRNYLESCYLSGMPRLEPSEYTLKEQKAVDLARLS